MNETTQEPFWRRCGDTTPLDRRNLLRVLLALGVWAVCFVGASQLIKRDLLPDGPIAWAVAALTPIASVFVLLAYARFLRQADELQRIIQLQALALGFGGTFFAVAAYSLFERLGAPVADLGDSGLVLAIFYSIGSIGGVWRYR